MMLARKCDRCGGFYEWYNKSIDNRVSHTNAMRFITATVNDNNSDFIKRFDLCPTCMKQLIKFIFMDADDMEESEDVE